MADLDTDLLGEAWVSQHSPRTIPEILNNLFHYRRSLHRSVMTSLDCNRNVSLVPDQELQVT